MAIPIFVIDLTAYKNKFWFFNERRNKILPDDEKISKIFSDSITDKMFFNFDSVVNDREGWEKEAIIKLLEDSNFVPEALNSYEYCLTTIYQKMLEYGWDERVKIRINHKNLAGYKQFIECFMDLEETIKEINKFNEELYEDRVTGEDIIDNPTNDQLSTYLDVTEPFKHKEEKENANTKSRESTSEEGI